MAKTNRHQMYLLKDLSECIDESLAILDQIRDKKLVVCFSGGKDSVVTEHICKLAGLKYDLIYNITTIDPPEVVKFIHQNYPQTIFSKPEFNFYQLCIKKFPPSIRRRWCCDVLKEKNYPGCDYKVMGIRAEESKGRQGRNIIDDKRSHVLPIYYWAEWHVWEYIHLNNLPYLSLYDEGHDRVGCVLCPFQSYKEHLRSMNKWPRMYKKFKEAITIWCSESKKYNFNPDEYFDQWIKKKGIVDL